MGVDRGLSSSKDGVNVCTLGHVNGACMLISFDLHSKHPVKFTQVSDFYMLLEASLKFVDEA
jgi:hypothetical protein